MKSIEMYPVVWQRDTENLRDLLIVLDDYGNIIMRLDFSSHDSRPLMLYYLMSPRITKL